MDIKSLLFVLLLSLSLVSCNSTIEESLSSSSSIKTSYVAPTYPNNNVIKEIFVHDQEMLKNYFGERINEYDTDKTVAHYQFPLDQFKSQFPDETSYDKLIPVIPYSFIHKRERVTINDSSNNPTTIKVSPNLFVFDIDTNNKLNTILSALSKVLEYVPFASAIARHDNKTYLFQKPYFGEYEEDLENEYAEYTTTYFFNKHYIELPSSDYVFPEDSFTIHISFTDDLGNDWSAGNCNTTHDFSFASVKDSTFREYNFSHFHSEIKIRPKYINNDLYAFDKLTQYFPVPVIKKDLDHSYLSSIVQHEFCHSLGLDDLYKKDDYNQDKIVLDLGDSIMYGLTDYGEQTLKERDINNILAIYDGTLYNKLLEIRNKYDPEHKLNFII